MLFSHSPTLFLSLGKFIMNHYLFFTLFHFSIAHIFLPSLRLRVRKCAASVIFSILLLFDTACGITACMLVFYGLTIVSIFSVQKKYWCEICILYQCTFICTVHVRHSVSTSFLLSTTWKFLLEDDGNGKVKSRRQKKLKLLRAKWASEAVKERSERAAKYLRHFVFYIDSHKDVCRRASE